MVISNRYYYCNVQMKILGLTEFKNYGNVKALGTSRDGIYNTVKF